MAGSLTADRARRVYVGALVTKKFEARLFSGKVQSAITQVPDDKKRGVVWPLLFKIRYEDGDKEDVTPEELQAMLVDPAAVQRRLEEVLGAGGGGCESSGVSGAVGRKPAAAALGRRRQRGENASGDENENDENTSAAVVQVGQAALADAEAAEAAAQPKRRRVLGDATERNGFELERRSRRDVKRRVDDAFEYEDERTAKRGAAGATQQDGAIRSRFGLRQPGQQAAAAELALMASESQVPYPVGEGDMRMAGLPGHLKSIEVFNFMCHEHFEMKFGNHATFVSGANGSGKSAVMQALQCCLGVKASTTGRANSFKKLIRTGTDEAIIRVTVWNRPYKGHDAYRHSLFGDTITVERRIANVGTASSYALKDANGRVHGRRREDLDGMLQTLGLNAANPVCVMTQDTARNFLAGSSNKADQEKYQLYMEATSLDQIAYNLELSKAQIRQMEEAVSQIREAYDKMRLEHDELRKSIAALEGIEGWRQEVAQLEKVLTWSIVEEQAEQKAQAETALLGQLPQLVTSAELRLEELRREHAALQQAVEGKTHFIASYTERSTQLLGEQEAARGAFREAHRAKRRAEAKIQQLRDALAEAQAQKETLEKAVQETRDDMTQATQAATQAKVAEYQHELEAAREEEEACREEVASKEAAFKAAAEASKAAHQRSEEIRHACYGTDRRIKELQGEIGQIREAGRSKLAAFGGQAAVRLVAAVQRAVAAKQFSRPPIGPVGQHLNLQDSRWGVAIESALGLHLNAFLVHSMADSRLLRNLIKQHFQGQPLKPYVYVVNFDYPQHTIPPGSQPPPGVPTAYRLLSCGDRRLAAPIMNNLVDTAHIEKLAFAERPEDAKRVGYQTSNVIACYTADGSKYYRRGSTNTYLPPPYWLRGARLGQSAAQQVSDLEQEVRRLQGELVQQEADLVTARQEAQAANEAERQARVAMAGTKSKECAARHMLTQLTQQPPADLMADSLDEADEGEAAQAEILAATQACIELEQQLWDRQSALEQAAAAETEAHAAMEEKKSALQRLEEENEQFNSTYEQEARQLAQIEAQLTESEGQADQLRCKRASLEQRVQEMTGQVAAMEEMAAQVCSHEEAAEERVAVEARLRGKRELSDEEVAALLTPALLGKKIKLLEKKITEHERAAGGSLDELQDQYAASRAKMNRDGKRFREAIEMHKAVESAARLRTRKLQELDHSLEALVNQRFRHYMWKKGHSGCIKLDRKSRSLALQVQMNSRGAGGGGGGRGGGGATEVRDLKQLSGGERSYTTVAFTLALGGQTEMPFRAMDEFDVFMDAINRRVAMQNLFTFAKDNPELQFIFLSPQDMEAVEDARQACQQAGLAVPEGFVKVVQMRPPRANATGV